MVSTARGQGRMATSPPEVVPTPPVDAIAPIPTILREIARGGLAGLLVGLALGGGGGRLVMRLAALLVPGASGRLTENGNVVGEITVPGSLALLVFVGLFVGAIAGSVWVVLAPWLPRRREPRAVVALVLAVALGGRVLVTGSNPDFAVLGRHPLVIASLIALVAACGPAIVLLEAWLDRRLPEAGWSRRTPIVAYALITAVGTVLTAALVVPAFLGGDLRVAGLALVLVGLATLASWWLRIARGRRAGPALTVLARGAIVVAAAAGLAIVLPHVGTALGLG